MKHPFALLFVAFTLICFSTAASADNDPLQAFGLNSTLGAKKLAGKLSGVTWIYHYEGHDIPIRFGSSGQIELFKGWQNVHWRVISPSEVLVVGAEGQSMIFFFNEEATTFRCKDWGNKPATGSRAP